ncbi:MAG: glycosyltransferase [Saprospiraceae bacterium]|nr:glycosyltransferase [Saprospiraceae bacterium]
MRYPKKILVAPLGWGLGHATRCVPIIHELQRQGAEVVLASDGRALTLLRQEFPELTCLKLPSYDVQYRSRSMVLSIAAQLPKILQAIRQEHSALGKIVVQHGIDAVISDNRFGCFSSKTRCIFITHQLHIPVPKWMRWFVNTVNHHAIHRFDACWVPDVATEPNLSGALSHPSPSLLRNKITYIGALTRMRPPTSLPDSAGQAISRYDVIAVLSGPEPQRTELEKLTVEQAAALPIKLLLVQGKPEQTTINADSYPKNIKVVPSMTAEALNQAIFESTVFIGRSGYSTVMDLVRLGKAALLIPTPGQAEQEYLAMKLAAENAFFAQQQHELNLTVGIAEAKERNSLRGVFFDEGALKNAVAALLQGIPKPFAASNLAH